MLVAYKLCVLLFDFHTCMEADSLDLSVRITGPTFELRSYMQMPLKKYLKYPMTPIGLYM